VSLAGSAGPPARPGSWPEPGARPRTGPPPGQLPRLLPRTAAPLALDRHLAWYGPVPRRLGPAAAAELIAEVSAAGLTGRGGAAFPAGTKLAAVAAAAARAGRRHGGAVLVANGVESEPGSGKDAVLLARSPHLVLDGIALAAQATGAEQAWLCVPADRPDLAAAARAAIAERDRAGPDHVLVQVTPVPGGYLASQETALVSWLSDGPQQPSFVPPRPSDQGVRGRPTLVQNTETLAHLALIARYGAAWFRTVGVPPEAGSALVTVTGAVPHPGVLETPLGTPLGTVLAQAGLRPAGGQRGPARHPQAVLAGGYLGGWLAWPDAADVPVSAAGLRRAGAALGPGTLAVLPAAACGLAQTARILAWLARQRAGQCGPCTHGLPALAEAFTQIAFARPHPDTLGWAGQLTQLLPGRGACHLPDGGAGLAASALRVFAKDLRWHAGHGPCPPAAQAARAAL
jgi:NADH:ubiquinone oxidoreductase subunit F (NADH-binding)